MTGVGQKTHDHHPANAKLRCDGVLCTAFDMIKPHGPGAQPIGFTLYTADLRDRPRVLYPCVLL